MNSGNIRMSEFPYVHRTPLQGSVHIIEHYDMILETTVKIVKAPDPIGDDGIRAVISSRIFNINFFLYESINQKALGRWREIARGFL